VTLTQADLASEGPGEARGRDETPAATTSDGSAGPGGSPRAGQAQRRTFSVAYKRRVVQEYDALTEHGARGAYLRREGLYQSHIDKWRRARDAGRFDGRPSGSTAKTAANSSGNSLVSSGRASSVVESAEVARLRRENERLAAELAKTQTVVEILGKAHALLEMISESAPPATR